jgi:DNA-binding XRE family transcriptional regulator
MGQEMRKNSIKEIRESLMVSKVELAKIANISPNTISRIEQGLPCRMETKRKIITALEHINSDENEVVASFIRNNGGKRLGLDRRQYSYDKHIPESRSGNDRRSELDRRQKPRKSE